MESDKNIIWKNFLDHLKFPGVLLIGIFIFLLSVLLFKRWESLLNMMSSTATGIFLIFIGIISYFKSFNKISLIGLALYALAVLDFYFFEKLITAIVATLYSLSIILILLSIIEGTNKQSSTSTKDNKVEVPGPVKDMIDVELGKVSRKLQKIHGVYQGTKIDSEMELGRLKTERKNELLFILEICENFEKLFNEYNGEETKEIKRIRIIRNKIMEQLEEEGVKRALTNVSDIVDDEIHIVVNPDERPPDWPSGIRPRIKSFTKPLYYVDSELLRKAHVEADWNLE